MSRCCFRCNESPTRASARVLKHNEANMKTTFLLWVGAALVALALTGCKPDDAGSGNAAKAKAYPLDTCIVSDEKLGSMGDPVVFAHAGQQVKLCCKSCRKDFDADPAKFLAKLAGK